MAVEPGLDLRMLMSGIVVLDQMDVEFLGCFAVDLFQESQPFDMSVVLLGARDLLAFHCIECGKQCDRAVPGVGVLQRDSLDEKAYCLSRRCSQRWMPLPPWNVPGRLIRMPPDIQLADP